MCLHPLHVLELYLDSMQQVSEEGGQGGGGGNSDSIVSINTGHHRKSEQERIDETLSAVGFLFGNTLEGALSILEPPPPPPSSLQQQQHYGQNYHHGQRQEQQQQQQPTITKVVAATSGRSVYLVKGSSCSGYAGSRMGGNNKSSSAGGGGAGEYLCIVPEKQQRQVGRMRTASTPSPSASIGGCCHYCSCRSFLERSGRSSDSAVVICKHLLALKLLPVFGAAKENLIETVSDDEFARIVVSRISV